MADGGDTPRRIIIPKGTLEPDQNNVIDIPEACEDSRVLIAKLQARFGKSAKYYPPLTNPENKFERRIGDDLVALGMPPLSPVQEERRNYKYSLDQYGPRRCGPREVNASDITPAGSSYWDDTPYSQSQVSGKFDYVPSSTPVACRTNPATDFPSPRLSPIRMGRDIFAPPPSPYRGDYTPSGPPPPSPRASPSPRAPSPRVPSPRVPSPRAPSPPPRAPSPRRVSPPPRPAPQRRPPPARRPPESDSDRSASFGDLSDMIDDSRRIPVSLDYTPESMKGLSQVYEKYMGAPSTPIPEELHNKVMNESMAQLDFIELDEVRTVQDRMRSFQDARRELVLSILALPEAEVSV